MNGFARRILCVSIPLCLWCSVVQALDSTSTGALGVTNAKNVYQGQVEWDSGIVANTAPVLSPGTSTTGNYSNPPINTNRICPPSLPLPLIITSAVSTNTSTAGNANIVGQTTVCNFFTGTGQTDRYLVYYYTFSRGVNLTYSSTNLTITDMLAPAPTPTVPYVVWRLYCLPNTPANSALIIDYYSVAYIYPTTYNSTINPAVSAYGYGLMCN